MPDTIPYDVTSYRPYIKKYADIYGVDPDHIEKMIQAESSGNPNALGPVTKSGQRAQGLMQMMPDTGKQYGLKKPFDPEQNISAGIQHFSTLLKQFGGDIRQATAAYNGGAEIVKKDPSLKNIPKETANYLNKIFGVKTAYAGEEDIASFDPWKKKGGGGEDIASFDPWKKQGGGATASAPDKSWKPASDMLENLWSGGGALKLAEGVGGSLLRPWKAASSLGEFAAGGAESAMTAMGLGEGKRKSPEEQAFTQSVIDPLKQAFKEPSDVPRRVWNYTVDNPVDQAMNVAGLLSMGGKTAAKASEWLNPAGLVTKPLAKGSQYLTNKFTSAGESASSIDRLKLANETGVTLSPADITGKKSHALLESQLRENVGSANKAEQFQNQKLSDVSKYADRVQSQIGGPESALSAGQVAQEGAWPRYRAFQKNTNRLKNQIAVEGNTPIETQNLSNYATEELDELGKLQSPTIKRILKITQEGMTPETTETGAILDQHGKPITNTVPSKPTYTWQQLRQDQSELGKMIERTGDRNQKRILFNLQKAIDEDIISYGDKVGSPEIKAQVDKFKDYYREGDVNLPGIRVWNDRQIVNMMRTNSPEDIVQKFIKAKANQSDITRLKQVAGAKGFQSIKQAWLEDMFTKGQEQSFDPAKFAQAYDKYRQSGNLDVMLTKEERSGLDKLSDISKVINTATKIAGNPSGTGRMYLNAAVHWVAHPVINTITQIGANRLAELYFNNPTFRNFLIKGLDSTSRTGKAIGYANAMAQAAAQSSTTSAAYQVSKAKAAMDKQQEEQPSSPWKEIGE